MKQICDAFLFRRDYTRILKLALNKHRHCCRIQNGGWILLSRRSAGAIFREFEGRFGFGTAHPVFKLVQASRLTASQQECLPLVSNLASCPHQANRHRRKRPGIRRRSGPSPRQNTTSSMWSWLRTGTLPHGRLVPSCTTGTSNRRRAIGYRTPPFAPPLVTCPAGYFWSI